MKKLLLTCLILAVASASFAQNKNKKEKIKVDFYGVDFSAVNVSGADETAAQFVDAFERINVLLVAEPKKYDVAKYLDLDVLSTDYKPALKQLAQLKEVNFKDREQSDIDIKSIVSNYPNCGSNGLIIIAKELNKPQNIGTFIAVIYDGTSKQILSVQELKGKAGGFGLRNFWAGSLYNGLKNAKYTPTKSKDAKNDLYI